MSSKHKQRYSQPHNILREEISEEELEEMEEDGRKPDKNLARLKQTLRQKIHHGLKRNNKSLSRFYEWLSHLTG